MKKNVKPTSLLSIACLAVFLGYALETSANWTGASIQYLPGKEALPQVSGMQTQVSSGQRFSTQSTEIREILFPDGTVLTLGSNSEAVVEKYDYDNISLTGEMTLRIEKGTIRVVGGTINNEQTITIKTPTSEVLLNNASVNLDVSKNRTQVYLLYGEELIMRNAVGSENIVRPEFGLISTSQTEPLASPQRQSEESAAAFLSALNTGKLPKPPDPDEQYTDFTEHDRSDNASNILTQATEQQPSGNLADNTQTNSQNPGPLSIPDRPGSIDDALDSADGFDTGTLLGAANTDGEQATTSDQGVRNLTQNRVPIPNPPESNDSVSEDRVRDPGPTTNRIFNSEEAFTQVVETSRETIPARAFDRQDTDSPSSDLQYVFEGGSILLDTVGDEISIAFIGGDSRDFDAPFAFLNSVLPTADGQELTTFVATSISNFPSSTFGNAEYKTLQSGFSRIMLDSNSLRVDNTHPELDGTIWENVKVPNIDALESRERDNFLLVQARPAVADRTLRDELKADTNTDLTDSEKVINAFSGDIALLSVNDDILATIASRVLGNGDLRHELDQLVSANAIDTKLRNIVFTRSNVPVEPKSLTVDPNRNERFLFAAGDIDGAQTPLTQREVHHFFLSAGLDHFDDKASQYIARDIRAFLRSETVQGLNLSDTGLNIVYPRSDASVDAQNALLHADFGLLGTASQQYSSISVTLGTLTEDASTGVRHAFVTGHTLASSHDNRQKDAISGLQKASTFAESSVFSTASGGGNPALNRSGRAGYLVLENFDPDTANNGGLERPLNIYEGETRYAFLRLATATGAEEPIATGANESFKGWAAGLAEFQRNGSDQIGINQIDSDSDPGNVVIQKAPEANRIAAQLQLTTDGLNFKNISFGGLTGEDTKGYSAYIDDDRFAARTQTSQNAELALVSGDLVKKGLPADMQALVGDYPEYLQWGFFFGDAVTTEGERQHVHLGTFAAGRISDPGDFPSTGTATYTGHAIGNVYNNGNLYTAVGSYNNAWNFGTRRGTVNMDFDGADLKGQTQLRENSVAFDGVVNASQRTGSLHGNFVQGGGDRAAGVVGRFSIQQTPDTAAPYRASGTFAAKK